jgi:glutamyl-tRNA reductase
VDPEVHKIDNAYVFNVDDLEKEVREGMKARQGEAQLAETLVEQEVTEFEVWARGLDVQPAVVALRAKTRGILLAELERSLGGKLKHLGEMERAALAQMMESAANKLLHAPTSRLKAGAADGSAAGHVAAVQHLFDLPMVEERSGEREVSSTKDVNETPDDDDRRGGMTH